VQDTDVVAIDH